MRSQLGPGRTTVAILLVAIALLAFGCEGDTGPAGPEGPEGPQGPQGPVGGPNPVSFIVLGSETSDANLEPVGVAMFGAGSFPTGSSVAIFNMNTGTPVLADLTPHDVALVYTDFSLADAAGVGDVLADYVDAGGRVVLVPTCFSSDAPSGGMLGRIMTAGYSPFAVSTQLLDSNTRQIDITSLTLPPHPVFTGIELVTTTFPGWSQNSDPPLQGSATLIATFENTNNAVAINAAGTVMAINLFPTSTPDPVMMKLFANAVLFMAGEL
jgi:hypothetical protein